MLLLIEVRCRNDQVLLNEIKQKIYEVMRGIGFDRVDEKYIPDFLRAHDVPRTFQYVLAKRPAIMLGLDSWYELDEAKVAGRTYELVTDGIAGAVRGYRGVHVWIEKVGSKGRRSH